MIINKLKKFIGVEINDLDITKILDIGIINEISELLSEFSVVVIRDQNITNDQHIKFSKCFGNLEQTKVGTDGSGSKLIILRNFDEDGNIVPPTDRQRLNNLANKEWHSDSSFKKIPSKLSILSAKMIPSNGGDTEFLSMRAAYNSLPENLKLNIEDKVCWHDYSHGRLKIDPNLGAHCSKIDGMTENESQNLLKEIYEFVDNKSFVYSHVWKPYDLIMWDNRSVLHRATPIKGKIEKRLMVRTTIAGETSTLND